MGERARRGAFIPQPSRRATDAIRLGRADSAVRAPLPNADKAVRVALRPPAKGEVHVEDPQGRPVAGARIRLEWFGREQVNVPEAVEDLIEATTDKDGRAVGFFLSPDEYNRLFCDWAKAEFEKADLGGPIDDDDESGSMTTPEVLAYLETLGQNQTGAA